jgi:hypothetical protein
MQLLDFSRIFFGSLIFNGPGSPIHYLLFNIRHDIDFISIFSESKGKSMGRNDFSHSRPPREEMEFL